MRRREAIAAIIAGAGAGAGAAHAAQPETRMRQMALHADAVLDVGGFAGERMRRSISARLSIFDVNPYVKMVEEHQYTEWNWLGEQPGKWLEAAILASGTFRNSQLHDAAAAILRRLIAAQLPDGYLGVTATSLRTPEHPLRGMDAYELYFTLHALLTAHEEWKNGEALSAAQRLADYILKYVGPGKAEFWARPKETTISGHAIHHGFEGTLLIDPIMCLHIVTGEPRYRTWCEWVVGNMDKWSTTNFYTNLDKVARGEMGMNQLLPKTHTHTFQMNAQGLLRLYQASGDPSYLNKVSGAWRDIVSKRMYITGGAGNKEYYEADYVVSNGDEGVETCSVLSWLQLSQALLEITGEPAYADVMERALWNHVFASQTWDADGYRYGVPLTGWKPTLYFTGPNCCSSNGPRMFAMLPGWIYGRGADGIYVNQFIDSKARLDVQGEAVEVTQRTDYPSGETIALEIAPASPRQFAAHVRIPGWCKAPRLTVNGRAVADVRPGAYARLERKWTRGDRVELVLPMETKWTRGDRGNAGFWALVRGPVVYVLDGVWQSADVRERLAVGPGVPVLKLQANGMPPAPVSTASPDRSVAPFYRVPAKLYDGSDTMVTMAPFGNLGRWYADAAAKPAITERLYPYAVWIPAY
jgi:DUF1680 family protein